MPTLLGGQRWGEQFIFEDDYVDEDEELSPMDDDYIPEEYQTEEI
jgi:hypothetical protein